MNNNVFKPLQDFSRKMREKLADISSVAFAAFRPFWVADKIIRRKTRVRW